MVAVEPLPTMKPLLPLTVMGIEAIPPAVTGTVAEVVAMVKVSVVAATPRPIEIGTDVLPLTPVTVMFAPVAGAMLATVATVICTIDGVEPLRRTLPELKVQVTPAGIPEQLPVLEFGELVKFTAWL